MNCSNKIPRDNNLAILMTDMIYWESCLNGNIFFAKAFNGNKPSSKDKPATRDYYLIHSQSYCKFRTSWKQNTRGCIIEVMFGESITYQYNVRTIF